MKSNRYEIRTIDLSVSVQLCCISSIFSNVLHEIASLLLNLVQQKTLTGRNIEEKQTKWEYKNYWGGNPLRRSLKMTSKLNSTAQKISKMLLTGNEHVITIDAWNIIFWLPIITKRGQYQPPIWGIQKLFAIFSTSPLDRVAQKMVMYPSQKQSVVPITKNHQHDIL